MAGDTAAILSGPQTQGLSVVSAYMRNIGDTAQADEASRCGLVGAAEHRGHCAVDLVV